MTEYNLWESQDTEFSVNPTDYFTVPKENLWLVTYGDESGLEWRTNSEAEMTEQEYCDATALATVRAMKTMAHGLNVFDGPNENRRQKILAALREIEERLSAAVKVGG